MRHIILVATLIGCAGDDDTACEAQIEAWVDEDLDGFGAPGDAQLVCELTEGLADNARDCDDTNPDIHPDAEELCSGVDEDCNGELDNGFELRPYYQDADGDGFGALFPAQAACENPGPGWVRNADDCDDERADVNPDATEVCNGGVDDDCDGLADDGDPSTDPSTKLPFSRDGDGDGYGDSDATEPACIGRAGYVDNDLDCDDDDDAINPDNQEICNNIDDDCDGLVDDQDTDTDPATMTEYYLDADADGFGDAASPVLACRPTPGVASVNGDDCDDSNGQTYPGQTERLCDTVDNDCDVATPDDRDQDGDGFTACFGDCADSNRSINPSITEIPNDGVDQDCNGLEACYQDGDGDGARTTTWVEGTDFSCTQGTNAPASRPVDCDDTDPNVSIEVGWYADVDGDGVGAGPQQAFSCLDPGGNLVPESPVLDCDNRDPTIFPGAVDPCNDGIDQDCSGEDLCKTCQSWLTTVPGSPDGVYTIEPTAGQPVDVYCDMSTDGGGWTLVGSTSSTTFDDAGGTWYTDLTTLTPATGHSTVWNGMRSPMANGGDIRFACKLAAPDPAFTVDLSFYGNDWYTTITTGTDTQSCFYNGGVPTPAPERRDNIAGTTRPAGDIWNSGVLEGEDSCSDTSDFTVDFDDRGMDSNQSDGTDWGEDDGSKKCGTSGIPLGAWFIFVREP